MFLKKVKQAIKRHGLIEKSDRILIGVSGGPDSLALLYALNSLKKEFNLYLHVAHLDHMLRPGSGKDREFVVSVAGKLRIPASAARINTRKFPLGGSLEEKARNARLAFFFKTAKEMKIRKIALGHNLDDQAETVLMRLLRGAGLYGLSGILPKRGFSGFDIIRPLIEIKRKDIDSFLEKKNIKPRIDETNCQDLFLRNRIRKELLPLLESKYNKNIKEVLSNTAENVSFDYDYLSRVAAQAVNRLGAKINIKKFLRLHRSIQRLLLRLNIAAVKGDTRGITFTHMKEIEDLIRSRPLNSIVDLPKRVSVAKKENSILIYRRKP